jgi:hypothetical protein
MLGMNAIKNFFLKIRDSVIKPESYSERLKEPFGKGLAYMYWLFVCVSLVSAVTGAAFVFAARDEIREFAAGAQSELAIAYPEELVLTISGGLLSTNVEEPYVIDPAFFQNIKKDDAENEIPTHMITIDTNGSPDDYESYDTGILFTRESAVFPDEDAGLRIVPYTEFESEEPIVINKENYDKVVEVVSPYIAMVPGFIDAAMIAMILLWPFIGGFFGWALTLLWLFFGTALVWILSGIMRKNLGYAQLYKLGLYGITIPLIYKLLSIFLPVEYTGLSTLIYVVWMGIVLSKLPGAPKPAGVAPKTVKPKTGANSPWEDLA